MYSLEVRPHLYDLFKKLSKKDKNRMRIIDKKVAKIRENPLHSEPQGGTSPLQFHGPPDSPLRRGYLWHQAKGGIVGDV